MQINPTDIAALAGSINPAQSMAAAVITGTVKEGAKMESAVQVSAPTPGKGENVDVQV